MEKTHKEINDCTTCSVWSKTALIIGGVGAGADSQTCKTGTFFLMSLALFVPIFRKKNYLNKIASFLKF